MQTIKQNCNCKTCGKFTTEEKDMLDWLIKNNAPLLANSYKQSILEGR